MARRLSGQQPRALARLTSLHLLDPRAQLIPFAAAPRQVGIDLGPVPQIVGDDWVHVGQVGQGEPLDGSFRRLAVLQGVDHHIQQHAGGADPHGPIGLNLEWWEHRSQVQRGW